MDHICEYDILARPYFDHLLAQHIYHNGVAPSQLEAIMNEGRRIKPDEYASENTVKF